MIVEFLQDEKRNPLSIKAVINLKDYSELCLTIERCQLALEAAKTAYLAAKPSDQLNTLLGPVTIAQAQLDRAKQALKVAREPYLEAFSQIHGEEFWSTIKTSIAQQCDRSCPDQEQLYQMLIGANATRSLVIETLDLRFIELVKNSIDAKIEQYILNPLCDTLLTMEVNFTITENKELEIRVSDNAGGFPKEYIDQSNRCLASESYIKFHTTGSKKRQKQYTFGGEGLGILSFYHSIYEDAELKGSACFEAPRLVKSEETAIILSNIISPLGAQITLRSPLRPYPKYVHEYSDLRPELASIVPLTKKRKNAPLLYESPRIDSGLDGMSGTESDASLNTPTTGAQGSGISPSSPPLLYEPCSSNSPIFFSASPLKKQKMPSAVLIDILQPTFILGKILPPGSDVSSETPIPTEPFTPP